MKKRIGFKKINRNDLILRGLITFFIISLCMALIVLSSAKELFKNKGSYSEELIRFHVLANSDSPEDQELKLKVRDRIIEAMNPKFETSKSLEETREIIIHNLEDIEAIASEEIKALGHDYNVKATLGKALFPTKSYGSITLPAGTYEALRIVIGKGEGSNWWCVLFPPLCFIDIKNGLTSEKTKNELMSVLSEEEFKSIQTISSEDQLPIKLKFKVVEIIEYAKDNFDRVVGMK
ncbi:MAG: stage II sporulation protein R [Christensenellales bacterium]